jgi:acetamidase/formamidase
VYQYTYGPQKPILHISDGDTVIAETRDAYGYDQNRAPLADHMKQQLPGTSLLERNPLVGPIYVEGVEEGDVLAVEIREIRLTRNVALSRQASNFGSLTGETPGKTLLYNEPIDSRWFEWKLDLTRNTAFIELPGSCIGGVEVPLHPFIGSIGVAPRFGRTETSLTPGEYGGNMDYREVRAGTTLYLPVWVEGGYLSLGDVHALQGHGEVNGVALEVSAEITLCIRIIKGMKAEWPRLVDDRFLMVVGSTRPLIDCIRISQIELLSWLTGEYAFQREEAWQLMAQVGEIDIANIVDPAYTAVSKFPRKYLPAQS